MTSPTGPSISIRRITRANDAELAALSDVLIDCVDGGASVSFMHPVSKETALAFWRKVAADAERGDRILIVAEDGDGILGTVQVVLAQTENQPHRGDLSKMLVHRRARRRGAGELLMRAAEHGARAAGKTLLVLDTADATADRLYRRLGWVHAGTIPGYALWPHGGLCDTHYFYRNLD